MFQVKPNLGIISPNTQVSISINTNLAIKEESKLNSKFQINACTIEQDEQGTYSSLNNEDLTTYWKSKDPSLIQQVQVKSRLKQPEIKQEVVQQELQQSIISEPHESMTQMYQSVIDTQSKEKDEEIQRYKDQIDQLQKEVSDYQLMLKSVKQQEMAVKLHANKFELKQVLITTAISVILGFIFGK